MDEKQDLKRHIASQNHHLAAWEQKYYACESNSHRKLTDLRDENQALRAQIKTQHVELAAKQNDWKLAQKGQNNALQVPDCTLFSPVFRQTHTHTYTLFNVLFRPTWIHHTLLNEIQFYVVCCLLLVVSRRITLIT